MPIYATFLCTQQAVKTIQDNIIAFLLLPTNLHSLPASSLFKLNALEAEIIDLSSKVQFEKNWYTFFRKHHLYQVNTTWVVEASSQISPFTGMVEYYITMSMMPEEGTGQ